MYFLEQYFKTQYNTWSTNGSILLVPLFSRKEDFDNQVQYTEWLKKYEDAHLGKYR